MYTVSMYTSSTIFNAQSRTSNQFKRRSQNITKIKNFLSHHQKSVYFYNLTPLGLGTVRSRDGGKQRYRHPKQLKVQIHAPPPRPFFVIASWRIVWQNGSGKLTGFTIDKVYIDGPYGSKTLTCVSKEWVTWLTLIKRTNRNSRIQYSWALKFPNSNVYDYVKVRLGPGISWLRKMFG